MIDYINPALYKGKRKINPDKADVRRLQRRLQPLADCLWFFQGPGSFRAERKAYDLVYNVSHLLVRAVADLDRKRDDFRREPLLPRLPHALSLGREALEIGFMRRVAEGHPELSYPPVKLVNDPHAVSEKLWHELCQLNGVPDTRYLKDALNRVFAALRIGGTDKDAFFAESRAFLLVAEAAIYLDVCDTGEALEMPKSPLCLDDVSDIVLIGYEALMIRDMRRLVGRVWSRQFLDQALADPANARNLAHAARKELFAVTARFQNPQN